MSKSKEGNLAFYSLKARWDCSCEWTHKSSVVSRSKSVKNFSNLNCWNADRLLQPSCLGWTFCLKTALKINKIELFLFLLFSVSPFHSWAALFSLAGEGWHLGAHGCPLGRQMLGRGGVTWEQRASPWPCQLRTKPCFPIIPMLCWHRQHGYWWLQGNEGMF